LKKVLIFLFSGGILFSCGNHGEEEQVTVPPTVLSEEQYAKVLADFSLAEAAGNANPLKLSGVKFDSAYTFDPLKDNNVSRELYDSTVAFYSRHPKLYKKVCDDVLNVLSKIKPYKKAKKDSASADSASRKPLYDVVLKETGKKKNAVIKKIRKISGKTPKEIQEQVSKPPYTIKKGIEKAEAERLKKSLESAGATIEMVPGKAEKK
jgi:ribosomal protein L7/L12